MNEQRYLAEMAKPFGECDKIISYAYDIMTATSQGGFSTLMTNGEMSIMNEVHDII